MTGASTGIGAALAVEAAACGARLVLSARRAALLERTRQRCVERGAGQEDVLVLPLDMTDTAAHPAALARVLQQFGQLDILVNNAGRSQRGRWEQISLQVDRDLFDLNVFSVVSTQRWLAGWLVTIACRLI